MGGDIMSLETFFKNVIILFLLVIIFLLVI